MPAEAVGNTRNDTYLVSEAIRFLMKDKENNLTKQVAVLNAYKSSLDTRPDSFRPGSKSRQDPPHLCTGRLRGNHGRRDDNLSTLPHKGQLAWGAFKPYSSTASRGLSHEAVAFASSALGQKGERNI
jgi:hypothetical protein